MPPGEEERAFPIIPSTPGTQLKNIMTGQIPDHLQSGYLIYDAAITATPSVLANIGHKIIIAATTTVDSRVLKSFNYPPVFEKETIIVHKRLSRVIDNRFRDGNTRQQDSFRQICTSRSTNLKCMHFYTICHLEP